MADYFVFCNRPTSPYFGLVGRTLAPPKRPEPYSAICLIHVALLSGPTTLISEEDLEWLDLESERGRMLLLGQA